MRVIKFRAWVRREKKMYPVIGIIGDMVMLGMPESVATAIPFDQVDLMQYLSHKDSKGTDICKSDIVRFRLDNSYQDYVGVVSYSFAEFTISYAGRKHPDIRLSDATRIEVIGNIYEHPELLEG